ncbi:MAG: response regulator [Acidimicrobiales bacterium]
MSADPSTSALDAVRVLLVDDQAMLRGGLRLIIDNEHDLVVVGEAGDGDEALRLVRSARPDVVLMDIQMPVMDGLAATPLLLAEAPDTKVLVLTTFETDDYIFDALRAGASGFLLKNAPPEDLLDAIRVVARGEALLSPSVTRRVITGLNEGVGAAGPAPSPLLDQLTAREREVLVELARGLSNAEIAERLFVGEVTVKTHVSNVLTKLGLRDRVQAVVFAYEHSVVTAGQPPDGDAG